MDGRSEIEKTNDHEAKQLDQQSQKGGAIHGGSRGAQNIHSLDGTKHHPLVTVGRKRLVDQKSQQDALHGGCRRGANIHGRSWMGLNTTPP